MVRDEADTCPHPEIPRERGNAGQIVLSLPFMRLLESASVKEVYCRREIMDLTNLTLAEQAALLRSGQCSSREIVDAYLARIERLDGRLHAYVEVYAAEARQLADGADRARAAALPLGPLHGLPICIKDLCDIAGRIGTIGSRMWAERRADATAAAVERLLAAGMIPLGKTHMVEFAFGAWGTNPLMARRAIPGTARCTACPAGRRAAPRSRSRRASRRRA